MSTKDSQYEAVPDIQIPHCPSGILLTSIEGRKKVSLVGLKIKSGHFSGFVMDEANLFNIPRSLLLSKKLINFSTFLIIYT